ncbi:MAG: class II SORL domain-containing protein [Nanoarchaeota archaeon]
MKQESQQIYTKENCDLELGKKHLPVVEVEESGNGAGVIVEVKVGNVEHPSDEDHFIQWIELYDKELLLDRIELSPKAKPRVTFYLKERPEKLKVREFCNIHGTWETRDQ